jgi:large subunit ribosomal protein L18
VANKPVRKLSRNEHRRQVHRRVRRRVSGTTERPRLCVYRSLGHIYAQVIDDLSGRTLVAASSVDKDTRAQVKRGGNVAAAKAVGKIVAERAKAAGIGQVVFDRGGYKYHGRVQALADAAREAGLNF